MNEAQDSVPDHISQSDPSVPTGHIVGSALEDGREAGDTRVELQNRIVAYLRAADRFQVPRRQDVEWRSAALQARDDLRDIEREFREATPPGEEGPNPPIGPGQTFADWTRPANTMRWIKELESTMTDGATRNDYRLIAEVNGVPVLVERPSGDYEAPQGLEGIVAYLEAPGGLHGPRGREGRVEIDRQFARRLLALLSGYRSHLKEQKERAHLSERREHVPEGRNLPDAIDKLRGLL